MEAAAGYDSGRPIRSAASSLFEALSRANNVRQREISLLGPRSNGLTRRSPLICLNKQLRKVLGYESEKSPYGFGRTHHRLCSNLRWRRACADPERKSAEIRE